MRASSRSVIAIVLPDLRSGGAERLHISLAKEFIARGFDVDFVLRTKRGELLSDLVDGMAVHELKAKRVRNSLFPLVAYLRARRPHAMLLAMWPLTVIGPLAAKLAGFSGQVVISEHAPLSLAYARRGRFHAAIMAATMALGYRLASARVGVSHGVAGEMSRLSRMKADAITVIHNPAATGRELKRGVTRPAGLSLDGPMVLFVGTLKPVKRIDLLLNAVARVKNQHVSLCIVGDGPERDRLENLALHLGLIDRVQFVGYQADPGPWFAAADLFVLCSDYEGFGNVIVEALEQGTPVVSTACPTGPFEILDGGRFGRLVPPGNAILLAAAIEEALADSHRPEELRERARVFSIQRAAEQYLNLLRLSDLRVK